MARTRRDPRLMAAANMRDKITTYERGLENALTVPLDKIIHITKHLYTERIVNGQVERSWPIAGMVVVPFQINKGSFRCRIIAQENTAKYYRDRYNDLDSKGQHILYPIRFEEIHSWKDVDMKDAGLYASWDFQSAYFKHLMYNQ